MSWLTHILVKADHYEGDFASDIRGQYVITEYSHVLPRGHFNLFDTISRNMITFLSDFYLMLEVFSILNVRLCKGKYFAILNSI